MTGILFTKEENELLKKIQDANVDHMPSWKLPNVVFPLTIVLISVVSYFLFKDSKQVTVMGGCNLMLNGSLAMFALNRLSSVGVNLFKFDKSKEKKASTYTYNLRIKINEYSRIAIFSIMLLYVYQVINAPFNFSIFIFLQIILSMILINYAIKFSRYSFLLQETLLERTLGDDIRDEAKDTKNHLDEKYG